MVTMLLWSELDRIIWIAVSNSQRLGISDLSLGTKNLCFNDLWLAERSSWYSIGLRTPKVVILTSDVRRPNQKYKCFEPRISVAPRFDRSAEFVKLSNYLKCYVRLIVVKWISNYALGRRPINIFFFFQKISRFVC